MIRKDSFNMNDGSNQQPRLKVLQSWWGMIGLGNQGREWSMEERFEKIAEAGFSGIMGGLPAPETADVWRKLLDDYKFSFGITCFPSHRTDLHPFLEQAKDFGVDFVNAQIMDNFVVGKAAEILIQELISEAKSCNLPFFVETHRGRVTQDLHRTVDYVAAVPDLRLTIDLSHYTVAGEMEQIPNKALPLFDRLITRTSCIHGRISNGQQIQIDIGLDASHPLVESYVSLWTKGMAYWRKEAQPGDLLPVLPELGPPHYAITSDGSSDPNHCISDRWQQALLIKRIFEEAWGSVERNERC